VYPSGASAEFPEDGYAAHEGDVAALAVSTARPADLVAQALALLEEAAAYAAQAERVLDHVAVADITVRHKVNQVYVHVTQIKNKLHGLVDEVRTLGVSS
jgi:hypothetical protein